MITLLAMKQALCHHELHLDDVRPTGIPPPAEPPAKGSYGDWERYYRELYSGDHHTKRVGCTCRKCGKIFFAHCGLDFPYIHSERKQ